MSILRVFKSMYSNVPRIYLCSVNTCICVNDIRYCICAVRVPTYGMSMLAQEYTLKVHNACIVLVILVI